MSDKQNLEHIEFETKYGVQDYQLIEFKQLVETSPETKSFIYVEGPDLYFTYPDWWFKNNPQWDQEGTFARYRKPSYGLDNGKRQVTWKYKPKDTFNNIQREEYNWDVKDEVSEKTIIKQLERSGMTFNFSIVKNCHIYKFEQATLVFYTVYDITDGKPKKTDSFVEIEVDEEKIKDLTTDQAFEIISKYEKLLSPLGVSAKSRLKLALFPRYRRKT